MAILTGLIYGALGIYLLGWYTNKWSGNFSLLLFMLTAMTMVYWLAERFYFRPRRLAAAQRIEIEYEQRRAALNKGGITQVDGDVSGAQRVVLAQPWWLDWTAGLFPVILVVFVLRSFLFEPFKIPSGSMIPTLEVGDLILVNKFHYGVRLPVINRKILSNNDPQRGDVMVFRYPRDTSIDYIKRVVGVPGDTVAYLNQRLYLNGQPVPTQPLPDYYDEETLRYAKQYRESFDGKTHRLLVDLQRQFYIPTADNFPFRENCSYSAEGITCKVPDGHYFMMGDNRDNSQDSRFWGFVPDRNIVGRAFFVWMNFSNLKRIGAFH